jgi:ABC-type Fe3+/spermidine/putrescine transport system ATPase subunit
LPGAGERSDNRVEGRVRRVSFLGNIVRYLVEAAPSTHVMVDVQNDGRPPLAIDTAIALGWAMDDSLILAG